MVNYIKGLFWGLVACVILSFLFSCKSVEYITIPEYHYADSVQIKYVRDSLFFHDSVSVSVSARNDTVIKEVYRLRYAYKDRLVRDTVLVETRDTVPKYIPKETKRVEYKYQTAWYDKICRRFTVVTLLVLIALVIGWIVRKKIKR